MSIDDDAASGVRLAQRAIHAAADGADDKILELINSATHAEVAWAASYLVSAVREAAWQFAKGNPRKTRRALHAAADDLEDPLMVRLALMLDEGAESG
ncbi:MAG: hypothetical protein JWQ86_926 [Mycobacterium sp.]|nr:hypothetical protein [Mycobacterium sp.]